MNTTTKKLPDNYSPAGFEGDNIAAYLFQYSRTRAASQKSLYHTLAFATLMDGIDNLIRRRCICREFQENKLCRHTFDDFTWLTCNEDWGPFAFTTICLELTLDPTYLRSGVLKAMQRDSPTTKFKRHEHRRRV